jgi:hypothetical protein
LRPRYVDGVPLRDAMFLLALVRLGGLFSINLGNYLLITYMRIYRKTAISGVVSAVYLLFILSGAAPPASLARVTCSTIGTGIVALLALLTITHCSIPESLLAVVAAYELVRRSRQECLARAGTPSESSKMEDILSYNHSEKTLEEEMVEKLAPVTTTSSQPATYRPVLNDIQDAAPIDYDGVI